MDPIDRKLLQFFTGHYKPGIIGIIGTTGTMGLAIREAQRFVTVDGKASLWSHCFIFGDLRLDRRGEGGTKSRSPYIFESDLKVNAFKPQLRNGAQENWIGKYCRGQVENAAVIDFGLSESQTEDACNCTSTCGRVGPLSNSGATWDVVGHHHKTGVAAKSGRCPSCHVLQRLCKALL